MGGGGEEQLPKSPLNRGPAAPGPTQPHHHVLGGGPHNPAGGHRGTASGLRARIGPPMGPYRTPHGGSVPPQPPRRSPTCSPRGHVRIQPPGLAPPSGTPHPNPRPPTTSGPVPPAPPAPLQGLCLGAPKIPVSLLREKKDTQGRAGVVAKWWHIVLASRCQPRPRRAVPGAARRSAPGHVGAEGGGERAQPPPPGPSNETESPKSIFPHPAKQTGRGGGEAGGEQQREEWEGRQRRSS